ncbi:hypothetical protein FF38_09507 [Lucilia cuprina]|uniref:Uncharacterized protein n=1 Tax=Lucilia cuprina TaxID=7375 RepID=A0A0L0C288_LUCCU|nr:hypothetical protein CVS40_3307 [Lucilia cuprina]KNC26430.1 hypothetical protein FF38_09507 [Lucilia cuprina]
MELRSSSRRRNEYKELQITLNGMGFYEEGMELQEMRQILDALQMSVTEGETNFLDCDMEQAIRESELDFLPTQDGRVLNSTMMSIHPNISPCSSPEIPSERIVVQAEVHHAMDWSPPNERLPRKRFATSNITLNNENIPPELELINELLEPDAKRCHNMHNLIENNKNQQQEANISVNANHTAVDFNNNFENSLQDSNSSFHEIRGPISVRRIHDSGFNMSGEMQHSSFDNNSSTNNHSSSDLNNLENSVPESNNSSHDVRGPISVRRIYDSGVNISSDMPNTSFNNLNEYSNSTHSFENSEQISTSSAVNPYDFGDDDSEPSI